MKTVQQCPRCRETVQTEPDVELQELAHVRQSGAICEPESPPCVCGDPDPSHECVAHEPEIVEVPLVELLVRLGGIPFGFGLPVGPVVDGASFLRWLDAFADRLQEHGARHRVLEDEHRALERDVAAVRRVLGTETS